MAEPTRLTDILHDVCGAATVEAEKNIKLILERLGQQGIGQGSVSIKLTFKQVPNEPKAEVLPSVTASLPQRKFRGGEVFVADGDVHIEDPSLNRTPVSKLKMAVGHETKPLK